MKKLFWWWFTIFHSEYKYRDNINTCDLIRGTVLWAFLSVLLVLVSIFGIWLTVAPIILIGMCIHTKTNLFVGPDSALLGAAVAGITVYAMAGLAYGIMKYVCYRYDRKMSSDYVEPKPSVIKDCWDSIIKKMCINIDTKTFK